MALSQNNLLNQSYTDLMVKGPVNITLTFSNGEILCGLEDIYKKLALPLFVSERVTSQENYSPEEFLKSVVFRGYVGIIDEPVQDIFKRVFEVYKPCEVQKLLSGFVPSVIKPEDIKILRIYIVVGAIGMEVRL